MKKVNIQTHNLHQRGQKRKFGTFDVVEFNEKGIASVPEDVAKYITKNHTMITLEGEPNPVMQAEKQAEENLPSDVDSLKFKINGLKDKLLKKDMEIKRVEGEKAEAINTLDIYKNLTNDLKKEIGSLNAVIETLKGKKTDTEPQKTEEPTEEELSEEDQKFVDEMLEGTKKNLLEMCEQFPEEEWEHFKANNVVKKTIALYLLEKTKTAN